MPRYEVRRRIENVVIVQAIDARLAEKAALGQPDDAWHCVWESIDQTIELVRCAGCDCDLERHDSEYTHEIDGQFYGTWLECACCPCSRCR